MTIIIDPQNAGISGNMIIGALVDIGADEEKVKKVMIESTENFGNVEVDFNKINKAGIESTHCDVSAIDNRNSISYVDLIEKIENLNLTYDVIEMAKKIFTRMALAESKIHGKIIEEIHFHEVGSADAVADVIGSVYAYYDLNLDKEHVVGLPIAVGGGSIESTHGKIPVPSPATLEILKGVSCFGGPINKELATPTGSAIYRELCNEFLDYLPNTKAKKIAYGAGDYDLDFPNVLRIIESDDNIKKQKINVIETNLDHMSGEDIGYLFDNLLIEGASDVSIIPVIMKKNRPGQILKVIARESKTEHLVDIIFKETGTLGIRISENTHRSVASREMIPLKVEIEGKIYKINFKIGYNEDEIISYRPEFEDIKMIAVNEDMPLSEVRNIANMIIRDYLDNASGKNE
ncbi:nickel pincer cofactor biosynthesis protein LarC [Methanobrevibacter sp. DSM 116169]|uniref:nickel pincer cofactor biosynthesis protein LarC n=1 Tax=Methanobrevibacter sp. DSM 116169 TaxID=3242727 RepID=UPI0038FCFECF